MNRFFKTFGIALAIAAVLFAAWGPAFVPAARAEATSTSAYSMAPGGVDKLNIIACAVPAFGIGPCLMYFAGLFLSFVSGVLVGMGAFLTTLALNLNFAMFDTPAIRAGFGVSLAVANLGFVLGIIVIAISTMLRIQSYGMKQLLLKLVVMAILVNFSMVIAVSILRFSDNLSIYFLQKVSPVGESSGVYNQARSIAAYADVMASSFAPQTLFVAKDASWSDKLTSWVSSLTLAGSLQAIANLFFIFFFTMIVVLAFFTLAILLFIRYAYIAILLVLMPLAWLLWIFPNFSKHFTDWWNKFLHYAFLPPLVLFFLYLAFLTVKGTGSVAFLDKIKADAASNSAEAFFERVLVYPAKNFLDGLVGMMIAGTLVFGGFFAANKFGIVGAGAVMSAAKGAGRWATGAMKGAAKYGARRGMGAAIRGAGFAERAEQATKAGQQATGWRRFLYGVKGLGYAKVARMGREDMVRDSEKRYKDYSVAELVAAHLATDTPGKIAIEGVLEKKKELHRIPIEQLVSREEKEKWGAYGEAHGFEDLEIHTQMSVEMVEALQALRALRASGLTDETKEVRGAINALRNAAEKLAGSIKPSDTHKINLDHLMKPGAYGFTEQDSADVIDAITYGYARANQLVAPRLLPTLGSRDVERFGDSYVSELGKYADQRDDDGEEAEAKMIRKKIESFKQSMAANILGLIPQPQAPTPPPAPAPAPTPPPQAPTPPPGGGGGHP